MSVICDIAELDRTTSGGPTSLIDRLYAGDIVVTEILLLLHQYGLLPKLLQEMLLEQTIAPIDCEPEVIQQACQRIFQAHGITAAQVEPWLKQQNLTIVQMQQQVRRTICLEKFKQEQWQSRLESHFLTCKPQFDQVVYSLLRMQDASMAQEVFFRIQSGEQSFTDAAQEFGQGAEAQTGGLIGPVPIAQPHPILANRLKSAPPGQVLPPIKLGEWAVILRLEKLIPAQFDEDIQQRLLEDLFQTWLQKSVQELLAKFTELFDAQDAQTPSL
jgi:parvulin-like peptidyl-prolyl isomerase